MTLFPSRISLLALAALAVCHSPLLAQTEDSKDKPPPELPAVRAKAKAEESNGKRLEAETLKRLPIANNDISSALRLSPRVQVSTTRDSALTQGEIAPAEISINGAKPYQNLFLLDGQSLNNDLDPAFKNPNDYADIPGASLGMPVDLELLCSLELLDSNIGAEHGGFQGGVIKAELCDARRKFGGRVTLKLARSAWSKIFVDPARESELELSATEDMQPRWDKQFWTLSAEGKPSKTLGLVAQTSYARSVIPLRGFTATQPAGDAALEAKEQKREQQDAMVKLSWTPDKQTRAWLSLRHQPLEDRYFNVNGKDTEFDIRGGGSQLSGGLQLEAGGWNWRQELSHSEMENSRRGVVPYLRTWAWSAGDKDWGNGTRGSNSISLEGAWGNVDTVQKTSSYQLSLSQLQTSELLGLVHRVRAGLALSRREAFYERPNDHHVYVPANRSATSTCTAPNGWMETESCSLTPSLRYPTTGQYWRVRDLYQKGKFEVEAGQYGLWMEDRMERGPLRLTLGLRADRDELAGKGTIAPRLAGRWVLDEAERSQLEFGLNRYYGRSFFNAALREKRETLKLQQTRNAADWTWMDGARALPLNRLKDLEVPYDDEAVLGLSQGLGKRTRLSLKWVHRESRDQLTRVRERDTSGQYANNQAYVYTNNGRGSADTLSLELSGSLEEAWLGARHSWDIGTGRSQVRSNHNDYETSLAEADADRLIFFKGKLMHYSELPADNFNRPWSVRGTLQSDWQQARISLFQMLRWTGAYRRVANTGRTQLHEGQPVDVFGETPFNSNFSWDVSLRWEPHFGIHRPFVQLSLTNLTNRKNLISISSTGVSTYEAGRAATVQVGYAF